MPIAMSAFTQEDLTKSQVTGGPDLMTQIPNFTFTKTNFTGYSIQIRGIGTQAISATTDAAVAVAMNNTPFIRNRFFEQEFYDLQRVEVLRGPQGTLYGRNATAGVVNIITAKPSFHYEAKLSGDLGNYNSTRIEGMVNLPIVDDHVALRLAAAWTKRDGYDTNQMTGARIDGRDLWSTRLTLRVEPSANVHANLIWEHFQEDDDRLRSGKQLCHKDLRTDINGIPMPVDVIDYHDPARTYTQGCAPASLYSPESFQTPNGFSLPYYQPLVQLGVPGFGNFDPYLSATQSRDLRVIESSFEPRYRARSDLGELQVAFDLTNNLTLTSETAYSRDTIWSIEDFNRFTTAPGAFKQELGPDNLNRPGLLVNGVFCDPQLGCSDRVLAADLSTAKSTQFSQEFRLSSDYDGPFNFSLGANFLRYDTTEKYYVFVNTLTLLSATILNGPAGIKLTTPPWDPYRTDNHGCMLRGLVEGDPSGLYEVGQCNYIEPAPISALQDIGHNYFLSDNPYKLISYAVFGEAYYKLTDNLKLTAGLRWTVDKKEAPRIPSQLLASYSVGYPVAEVIDQEWREPTGRLALDWKPDLSFTDETLIYGSYSHGYKAGGANPPKPVTVSYCQGCEGNQELFDAINAQSLTTPRTFAPEFINAFEVGSKNTLLGGHLTLNGDAFYYDYTGYQISEIVDRSAFNHNYDAKVWGLEFEADWRPLENLRLGLKTGYEDTQVAKGMYAVDLMDRTAGDPNWVVAKPFPTVPSNCIIPTWIATYGGYVRAAFPLGPGFCQEAYQLNHDPVTQTPYVANPQDSDFRWGNGYEWPNYPGWDPSTAPNNGEGIAKNLSGNALPNAPHYTVTVTADYTLPLPSDWSVTLHGDFYYQSEAWTRIFNDPGYDKLKAYNNVNFAAIFANEDRGWTVMAYVKNVLNKDNITGAFLNSDDTGLTTNVFLNEPRLYGLRMTKNWTGGSVFGSGNANAYQPIQVELAGQVLRHDAPYATLAPDFFNRFPDNLNTAGAQHRDQDWGQGGSVRMTYAPQPEGWGVSGGVRWGRTNASDLVRKKHVAEEGSCLVGVPFQSFCANPDKYFQAGQNMVLYPVSYSNAAVKASEEHQFVDFQAGKEVGLGGLSRSKLGVGVGYASLKSTLAMSAQGVPSWTMPTEWAIIKYSQHHREEGHWNAEREFKGAGPILSWDAADQVMSLDGGGVVNLDWAVNGGVLFGKQKARIDGTESNEYFDTIYYHMGQYVSPTSSTTTPVHSNRSKSVAVPMLDLSVGLSYEVDRFKVGAGYRWERYFNAIDGGYQRHQSFDRTYDGPYFKVSVGFGG